MNEANVAGNEQIQSLTYLRIFFFLLNTPHPSIHPSIHLSIPRGKRRLLHKVTSQSIMILTMFQLALAVFGVGGIHSGSGK